MKRNGRQGKVTRQQSALGRLQGYQRKFEKVEKTSALYDAAQKSLARVNREIEALNAQGITQ